MVSNIIGFHANYASKFPNPIPINCFIVSNDTDWLGNGMYYWDNLANARYWVRSKKRQSPTECIYIIIANIIIDQILDLTDYEIIEKVEKTWLNYCRLKHIVDYSDIPIGVRLNRLFEFFSDYKKEYKVIKGIGYYKKSRQSKFLLYDNVGDDSPYLTSQIKTIYCVKCQSKICDLVKIEEI